MSSLRSVGRSEWETLLVEVVPHRTWGPAEALRQRAAEGSGRQARADVVLEQIRTENTHNQSQIDSSTVAYHEQIRDPLRQLANQAEDGIAITGDAIRQAMPDGFRVPLLQKTGWCLSVQTGIIN